MKTVTYHQCEICSMQYDNFEDAMACEAKAKPAPRPVGYVYAYADPGDLYYGMAFAVAESGIFIGHGASDILWACRDTAHGDSLGVNRCGGGGQSPLLEFDKRWLAMPTFRRLVEWLVSQRISPLVYDNGEFSHLWMDKEPESGDKKSDAFE